MKKKRLLFSLLMAIVMMAMSPQKVWATNGTLTTTTIDSKTYYQIADAQDLAAFSDLVSARTDGCFHMNLNAILTNDITWDSSLTFKTIGVKCKDDMATSGGCMQYTGIFDGNGHTIRSLRITVLRYTSDPFCGMFAKLNGATVKNLSLTDVDFNNDGGYRYYGVISGVATGSTLSNVYVEGAAKSSGYWSYAAGLVGSSSGCTYTNCGANLVFTLVVYDGTCAAGLVYQLFGTNTFNNCYFYGSFTGLKQGYYDLTETNYTYTRQRAYPIYAEKSGTSTFSNCYAVTFQANYGSDYTARNTDAGITYKKPSAFASGEVAYLLNGSQDAGIWRQKLSGEGVNTTPVLKQTDDNKVYGGYTDCAATEKSYANSALRQTQGTFGDDDPGQTFCTACNHTFFRYTATKRVTPKSDESEGLKDANGNAIYVDSQNTWDATTKEGIMEFNKPLVTIGGDWIFSGQEFTGNLNIPVTVTSIGDYAFQKCYNITGLTLPNSVTTIKTSAFQFTNITSVTIPRSVTSIEAWAFSSCGALSSINVESGNTKYDSRNNCNAIIETNTNTLIVGCNSTAIPNSVTSIANYAFYDQGLTCLTIPYSVTKIGREAFYNCTKLKNLEFRSIPQIDYGAFKYTSCTYTLALSDESYVYTGSNEYFPAITTAPTFSRETSDEWGTIVVPFAITYNASNGNYKLYKPTGTSGSAFSHTEYADGTSIAAGTPMIIKAVGNKNASGKFEIKLTANSNAVNTAISTSSVVENAVSFTASYATTKLKPYDGYLLNENGEWQIITTETSVAPFHAYLSGHEHQFAEGDPTRSVCTVCNHGFFRYSSTDNNPVTPNNASQLLGADGNALSFTNKYVEAEGKCIMEFNKPLVTIGYVALRQCTGFTGDLIIPNSVKNIGNYAFFKCGFTGTGTLTIGSSVESIGYMAFKDCTNLTYVEMKSVPSVGEFAFNDNVNKTLILCDDSYVYTGGNPNFPTINSFSYPRTVTGGNIVTFVLPVSVPVSSINGKVWKFSTYEDDKFKFTAVTDDNTEANVPYLVQLDKSATELLDDNITGDLTINALGTPMVTSADGLVTHIGSYTKQSVASDANSAYYGFSQASHQFVKATTGTLNPFRTMFEIDNFRRFYDWASLNPENTGKIDTSLDGDNWPDNTRDYTFTAKAGDVLSFNYKVSSDGCYQDYGHLKVYLCNGTPTFANYKNGEKILEKYGDSNSKFCVTGEYNKVFDTEGKYTLVFEYVGCTTNDSDDKAWVTNIKLTPLASSSTNNAKAYIDLQLGMDDDEETQIIRVDADAITGTGSPMYNLQGQRITNPVKGQVYIRNGKKVLY